jgi:hypothetical protein
VRMTDGRITDVSSDDRNETAVAPGVL